MKQLSWAAGFLLTASAVASTSAGGTAEAEGGDLARQLAQFQPAENSSLSGALRIFPGKNKRIEVPVEVQTLVTATNWQVTYVAGGTNKEKAMSVTIIRTAGQPNEYRTAPSGQPGCSADSRTMFAGDQAMTPFAESDFWLVDLGLEFFHWPKQKVLKKELRSGQACSVLESTNPTPVAGGYSRVVSWIDIDTDGIVYAEAYDEKGDRLKRFEPKALKKVNGQWQLQEMQIRNLKTGSRTTIEFKLSQN